MLLVYAPETTEPMNPEDARELIEAHRAVLEETTQRGILCGCAPLERSSTATVLHRRDGQMVLRDGPFADVKEQLAGYFILDCADLNEALEWAAKIPTGCGNVDGCIEVRPVRPLPEPPGARRSESTSSNELTNPEKRV